jgi:hypothetical protein
MMIDEWLGEGEVWDYKEANVTDEKNPLVSYRITRFMINDHRMLDIETYYADHRVFSLTVRDPDKEAATTQWELAQGHARMLPH